ncbi:AAA family ATPase [Dickeya dianthicola]|uniref:retron Ec78 anti-phage system effector ATPase PtuA n=1 Tax=Dickeya dianthicola TaxID=204039 RepID=UPI000420C151|nr:retron Ec78 anti-phage system effector ATPase PtuA [Dickeya dianthicola]MCI4216874.1 AAA family ATPase [Dickeya dianthicola]
MTKQLERRAKGGNLLSAFELYQHFSKSDTPDSKEKAKEWFDRCWRYLQVGEVNELNIFRPENDFYLRSLSLTDFRRFAFLDMNFEDDLTVIIGNNGQGKTSILTAIAKTLSWFSANILKEDGIGQRLNETTDIRNGSEKKYVDINSNFYFGKGLKNIQVRLSRSAPGTSTRRDGIVKSVKEVSDIWRIVNEHKTVNLPIFAFYSVERSHPFNKSTKDAGELREERFDAYTNALAGAGRFDHFIEWFIALHKRTADDVSVSVDILRQQVSELQVSVDNGLLSVKSLLEQAKIKLNEVISKEQKNIKNNKLPEYLQKKLIVHAISTVVPSISDIWVEMSSGVDVVKITNDGKQVTVEQLSDGQRVFLSLVADLARRMIMLNPLMKNPFEGRGIILIDEIELHLHPKWQQDVVENLRKVFPNVQQIITTHSPIVLSTVDKRCIRQFRDDGDETEVVLDSPKFQTKGVINSDILEQVMNVFALPPRVAESHWVGDFEVILEQGDYENNLEAKELYKKISEHFGPDSFELKRCDSLIRIKSMKLRALARKQDKGQQG